MKFNISIISSHRDFCGPAAHTTYLAEAFKNHTKDTKVNICKLDVQLLRSNNKFSYNKSKIFLDDMIKQLQLSDKVIFQFEPGLLSSIPKLAYKRANYILKKIKTKKVILIIHGFDRPQNVYTNFYGFIKNFKQYLRNLSNISLKYSWSYRKFLNNLKKCNVICFSKNDVKELELFNIKSSYYPITYLTKSKIQNLKNKKKFLRNKWLKILGLNQNCKIIVLFGFISSYKNFSVVFEAFKYFIDKKWRIVIAGGLHPFSDDDNSELFKLLSYSSDRFLDKIKYIENIDFNKKTIISDFKNIKLSLDDINNFPKVSKTPVTFTGTLSDEDLNELVSISDCNILPYVNTITGQSGSGPFCISTELSSVTLISAAKVFMGQHNISKSDDFIFDANNHLELANKVNRLNDITQVYKKWNNEFRSKYNIENFIHYLIKD